MKPFRFSFILFLLVIGVVAGSFFILKIKSFEKEISEISLAQLSIDFKKPAQKITLYFVGDIMLNRGVEYMVKKNDQESFKFPFLKIADELKEADILFGNLEGPISDKGKKVGSIYSFRMDPKAIEGLKYADFNILSVANNHMFDYGREALEDTFLRLKEAQIDYVGGGFNEREAYAPIIKEIGGTKIAFLAYTNLGSKNWQAEGKRSGIALLRREKLERDIEEAKNKANLVIISFHFGDEYQKKSNFNQKFWARLAIDLGADLVIGHHPHVVQEIENYNGRYIAYSLGNFIFDQGFSEETMEGLILEVLVESGKIKEAIPRKIKINNFFQPEIIE